MGAPAVTTLYKHAGEVRLFDFDFVNFDEFDPEGLNQTIVTAQVGYSGPDTALSLGIAAFSGSRVQTLISGGTAGALYTVTAKCQTNGGYSLAQDGYLQVLAD